jgi:dTDP-4-amino-4,6-dideoxygalactose transaminase
MERRVDAVVPMGDLAREYAACRDEVDAAIARVLASGRYVLDEELRAFEAAFAAYVGRRFAVGVASGSAALQLALVASGLEPGDEVITVPNSDSATVTAITHAGGKVAWVDVDPETFNMSPAALEARISDRTRAVVPVHLFGQPADMDPLLDIARRHGAMVIEDAALAVGAEYRGRRVGSFGELGCFSLAPSKILGGIGDGGVVVTDDPELEQRLRVLRNYGHGSERTIDPDDLRGVDRWDVVTQGFNERLDSIHAAVVHAKLPTLEGRIAARRRVADTYDAGLAGLRGVSVPHRLPDARHVFFAYVLLADDQERLRAGLAARGVASRVHYVPPLHLQPAFGELGHGPGAFPVAESIAERMVGLPAFPQLTDGELDQVVAAVRDVCVT